MKSVVVLLILVYVAPVLASQELPHPKCVGENCSEACSDANPHRVFHYEVMDQAGFQICYAASASVMAQAADHPRYRAVSYIATAITSGTNHTGTNRRSNKVGNLDSLGDMLADGKMFSSGWEVFEDLHERGTCFAEDFPLQADNRSEASAHQHLIAGLARYFETINPTRLRALQARASDANAAAELLQLASQGPEVSISNWINEGCGSSASTSIDESQRAQFQSLLDNIRRFSSQTTNTKASFLALLAPACAADPYKPRYNADEKKRPKLVGDRKKILSSLCQGLPVSFNTCNSFYDARFLKPATVNTDHVDNSIHCNTRGGAHVMTLVGSRERVANQVEYLVQNSYGRSCPNPIGADGRYVNPSNGIDCEMDEFGPTGRFWLSRERFERMAYKYSIMREI
jgi:hypothetical protein